MTIENSVADFLSDYQQRPGRSYYLQDDEGRSHCESRTLTELKDKLVTAIHAEQIRLDWLKGARLHITRDGDKQDKYRQIRVIKRNALERFAHKLAFHSEGEGRPMNWFKDLAYYVDRQKFTESIVGDMTRLIEESVMEDKDKISGYDIASVIYSHMMTGGYESDGVFENIIDYTDDAEIPETVITDIYREWEHK